MRFCGDYSRNTFQRKPFPLPKRCVIIKIMECDFKKELEDELEKMIFLYDFCYFNNAVIQDEIWELGRFIKTHREVIKVLGGKND